MSDNITDETAVDNTEAVVSDTSAEGTEVTMTEGTPAEPATAPAEGPSKAELKEAHEKALQANLDTLFGSIATVLGDAESKTGGRIDPNTGQPTEEDLAALVKFYSENFPKAADQKAVEHQIDELLKNLMVVNFWPHGARAVVIMKDAFAKVGKRPKSETVAKPVVDPTTAHVAQVVAHSLAANFIKPGEGVDEGWQEKAQEVASSLGDDVIAYRDYLGLFDAFNALSDEEKEKAEMPSEPEVDPIVVQAARLARGRAAGKRASTGTGTPSAPRAPRAPGAGRADVIKHIKAAFEGKPVGTVLKVAAIANFVSDEYPEGNASGGAIAARIKKDNFASVAEGLVFDNTDGQAVRKVA